MLEVRFQKKFLKDLANLPPNIRKEIEHFIFETLPQSKNLAAVYKFEKMTGYDNYFKARFGDYRIGVFVNKNSLELIRVLHRKEIYRFLP
jgi:mRNA interferase RelE/StbE